MLALGEEQVALSEQYIADRMVQLIKNITQPSASDKVTRRFNQAKTLGLFDATFEVLPDLPDALAKGVFAHPGRYGAQVRLASASTFDDRKKDLRGASIKVFGLPGETLMGEPDTHDFLLNSYPVLFAADPESFLRFIEASANDRRLWYFINPKDPHFLALQILLMAREHISSAFDIPYWSTTPYRFGPSPQVAVKYKLTPVSDYYSVVPTLKTPNYLRDNMRRHLKAAPAVFEFGVQFQMDPDDMPIENASRLWMESVSPFHTVARVTIVNQDFQSDETTRKDNKLSFNPWQCTSDHRPIGGINRVRKQIYEALAAFRTG